MVPLSSEVALAIVLLLSVFVGKLVTVVRVTNGLNEQFVREVE
jgi:hypothetical protein